MFKDDTMIGVGLILLSLFFFGLSLLMMLDRGFLVLANVSFLMGTIALLGPKEAANFFSKESKRKASAMYFFGLVIIVMNFPLSTIIGFSLQIYGMYLLFKSFLKVAFSYV